jgi:hypothetical protein
VSSASISIDWGKLEEVVERAVKRARAEELKDVAEAIKTLADYVKKGFDIIAEHSKRIEELSRRIEETNKVLMDHSRRLEELTKAVQEQGEILAEHTKILAEHSKRLEELTRAVQEQGKRIEELARKVGEQSAVLGSIGRRWGRNLEKMVIELYRHVLEEKGIIPEKIERFTYIDTDGRYYVKGSRIEFDIYIHNDKVYLVEVKSHADIEDVEWFYKRAEIYEKIRGRKPDKLVLVAVHIDEDAYERAKELGIEVIYGAIVP